jgi:FkbM family methyltransferase
MRTIFFSTLKIQIHGDTTDRYFLNGFTQDGWQSCGKYLNKIIKHDSVCIDIGANIGITTIGFSLLAKNGHVYSIEPSPKNYAYLSQNIEENGIKNVSTHKIAIANTNEDMAFYDTDGFRAGSFLCKENENIAAQHHHSDNIKVKTVPLDEFIKQNNIKKVDFIKIDVEGFEYDVIESASKTIKEFHPTAVIEFNPYCLVSHANFLPNRFLEFIFSTFDQVFVHREQENSIKEVKNIHDKHDALHDAFKYGLVNLICTFKDSQLNADDLDSLLKEESNYFSKNRFLHSKLGYFLRRKIRPYFL